MGLALFALLVIGDGMLRGWRAWVAAAALLRDCGPANRRCVMAGLNIDIVDVPEPMVAVIGRGGRASLPQNASLPPAAGKSFAKSSGMRRRT